MQIRTFLVQLLTLRNPKLCYHHILVMKTPHYVGQSEVYKGLHYFHCFGSKTLKLPHLGGSKEQPQFIFGGTVRKYQIIYL